MSLLFTAILLVIAYVLLESGLTVFALVAFLLAVLQLLSKPSPAAGGVAAPTQRPVIVTTSGGQIPPTIRIVTKKPWPGTDLYEDFQTYLGGVLEWPFRILIRLFTGKMGKPLSERQFGAH